MNWSELFPHEPIQYLVLFVCAALASGINAVAGGGTLITFPALFAILGPVYGTQAGVIANATSTVALFPGAISAIGAYWEDLRRYRRWVVVLLPPSMLGGLAGALLLTLLDPKIFDALVPWLILLAASLFTLQPRIAKWFGIGQAHASPAPGTIAGVALFQFAVGIYGGYFGAGIGILMLSALALMGMTDIHAMNALKSALNALINGVAVVVFVAQREVDWPLAIWMAIGAAVGSVAAVKVAKRVNKAHVRTFVIVVGYALAARFFYQQWAGG